MILQQHIPYDISEPHRLPGVAPFEMADWLCADEAYAGQMGERLRLLTTQRETVVAEDPAARPAALELLDLVLANLPGGFAHEDDTVLCPDGRRETLDRRDPLGTLGRLVQQDLCVMEKRGAEHVLTAAVLCFPASWRLSEKFLRPLTGIHVPVKPYDTGLAKRVQRLFDGVQEGRPLWRMNALPYGDAALHQPRGEAAPRQEVDPLRAPFLRSERQCLVRLPKTRAVVFSIHTRVVRRRLDPISG
ncbi:heme-dependent oxidative N-demethylase family protein [Sagittula salina]|uniref:DUF3445 domain-containing protein n=1 Tax=Sagittula salina TaxID=2820268 RepID=A0A940S1Z3_9RHOB|nr:DUF3445 domain-containing protein [Sagittula salina]MBP0481070.1 DUF3445 domain-containing protein [Sagittula salina]